MLNNNGVFCAYKYDFPIVYGKLHDFINYELATKWAKFRNPKLIDYDDTLELLQQSEQFKNSGRFVIPNIIELTGEELAYFFLSTSYVTLYIEQTADTKYGEWFVRKCIEISKQEILKVNFDINAYYTIS